MKNITPTKVSFDQNDSVENIFDFIESQTGKDPVDVNFTIEKEVHPETNSVSYDFSFENSDEELTFTNDWLKEVDFSRGFQLIFDTAKKEIEVFMYYTKDGNLHYLSGDEIKKSLYSFMGAYRNSQGGEGRK